MASEIARLARSKCHLGRFAGFYLYIDPQIANINPMADIQAFQNQYNGLPRFHGDLAGLEGKFLSRDLYALRRRLGSNRRGKNRRSRCTEKQNSQHNFLHSISSSLGPVRFTQLTEFSKTICLQPAWQSPGLCPQDRP